MNRYRVAIFNDREPSDQRELMAAAKSAGDAIAVCLRSVPNLDHVLVRCNLYSRDTDDVVTDFNTVKARVIS